MDSLTIGAFAKASRLSPKALRLYDELGLLTPARVDPLTGYRHYAPAQLERARLVSWLRRLGMPLARIRKVCALPAPAAAREIRAYWAQAEAAHGARRDLAAFLVDHLSRKDLAVNDANHALELRYAALSDAGLVRPGNQDTAYAGDRLLAVADGFGGEGAPAGAAAVDALKALDTGADGSSGGLLDVLQDALERADETVRGYADSGTTLTALLWSGERLALVHIGDSRAYLLRDGDLFRITHDHTMVQSMVDEGRLTEDEAVSHPQRSLLVRALGSGTRTAGRQPDLRLHDPRPGDRYLLCTDGLSTVVPDEELRRVLASGAAPGEAVRTLVELANAAGGPDNVSCVVADVQARSVAA
ncbi:MerR family transcriptional regulator [Actinacidiphila sp. bgisy167]|uniref:MerR family transcriptional regulator n=1 Tax=Actinacidiphila sp. bgisy167 TaxID=3413797 RepID=UPI003D71E0DA